MGQKKYMKKHNLKRLQLDIPEETRDKLREIADNLGVPQSQLVTLLLEAGFADLEAGALKLDEYLEPAQSPLFSFTLDIDKFKTDKGSS